MSTDPQLEASRGAAPRLGHDPGLVSDGLIALQEEIKAPHVRRALAEFQADFARTDDRLMKLFALQRLLARFQELDECNERIEAEVLDLNAGAEDWQRLQLIVGQSIDLSSRLARAADAVTWTGSAPLWAERLGEGNATLLEAAQSQDLESVEMIADRQKRAIQLGEPYASARMLHVLEELHTSDLLTGVGAMLTALTGAGASAVAVSAVAGMLSALERVCARLHSLASACVGWRELLHELRFVADECRAHGPENLDRAWADISATSRRMLDQSAADPATSLPRNLDAIDLALQESLDQADFDRALAGLTEFFGLARACRRWADAQLNQAVSELEGVRQPLHIVAVSLS
jgi:hypothetical protein